MFGAVDRAVRILRWRGGDPRQRGFPQTGRTLQHFRRGLFGKGGHVFVGAIRIGQLASCCLDNFGEGEGEGGTFEPVIYCFFFQEKPSVPVERKLKHSQLSTYLSVCVVNLLFILPHTDPTGSWRQLGFRSFLYMTQSRPRPVISRKVKVLPTLKWGKRPGLRLYACLS